MNNHTTLALSIIIFSSFLRVLANECVLNMGMPSYGNGSNTSEGNWGGFLTRNSCGSQFNRYLYGLANRENGTENVFLNITQQKDCLNDVLSCGFDKLTSGAGGCSDYTETDVVSNYGSALENLDQDCKNVALDGNYDKECGTCFGTWERVIVSDNRSDVSTKEKTDICRFSLLVTLTSRRIKDSGWIQSVYMCLGNGFRIDDQERNVKKVRFVKGLEVLIGGVIGITLVVAVALVVLLRKPSKIKPPKITEASVASVFEESSSIEISLREVYLSTNNLSELNLIGQGIAGKVYKGVLSDGCRVAVKHIINDAHMETFVREVTSLSHVKHQNLVELLGHCDGQDESFLVYELCDNGNLSEWLFGKDKILTWIQRLEIAIDCGKGLRFLHTFYEGCIVHRDIKPTNILLGSKFQAKLSDFGLSKVISMGQSYVSSEVRGTFGYVDPEYQKNHHVHPSTDVYSFGIVLLQLLSGQRVINLEVTRPMPLSKIARILMKGGDITEFADPKLNGEYSVEGFQLLFKLALSCTGHKHQRPSMERVVTVLEKARRVSERTLNTSFQST
ncbi:putative receptor-like protein kinase [Dorcoceras hygrometricum]|uniref:Putative receptor-like protein kinase n=1 Tax=Dorcoceras hygrometricum TaxID=472368 RepID=A0A2Z7C9Z3_9LAMI|nr:putative receptor-like protein kinase [Dorcoceras hygrometricum]